MWHETKQSLCGGFVFSPLFKDLGTSTEFMFIQGGIGTQ